MKIHMYGILWNEAPLLPYFFRHYDPCVERYVLYDNGSDDGTLEILARHPCVEIRHFEAEAGFVCETATRIKSHAWKESRADADLVLVCDVDELISHPHLAEFLAAETSRGCTIFQPQGYQMVSERFPTTHGQIDDEVTRGFPDAQFNKPCLFHPREIEDIRFTVGCHAARPTGNVVWSRDPDLKLLHFKYLGPDYLTARYRTLNIRRGRRDHQHRWGKQYALEESAIRKMFGEFWKKSSRVDREKPLP